MRKIQTDIVVLGGGISGLASAVSASRAGRKVCIVEKNNFLGGKATAAEVGTICGLYAYSLKPKPTLIAKGFMAEFANRLQAMSAFEPMSDGKGLHYLPYSIEEFKLLCEDYVNKNHIDVWRATQCKKAHIDQDKIQSILVVKEEEEIEICAHAFIDCSGESILSQQLQLELIPNSSFQAAAQIFTLKGIPSISEKAFNLLLMKEMRRAVSEENLPAAFEKIYVVSGSLQDGQAKLKLAVSGEVNYTANNLIELRQQALDQILIFLHYVNAELPFFKDASLSSIAPELGTRTGLRPKGKYILDADDVLQCRKFNDAIANASWPIEQWSQDKKVHMQYFSLDDYYQIPATSLQSAQVANLFFAGRHISATDEAIASARVIGTCLQTGYAAGKMASHLVSGSTFQQAIFEIQSEQILY